jgi:hypothetical protein
MTPAEKWANTKNANDSTTKKALKTITRGGQFMLNNPGYIVGTQLGIVATGVGSAYADYKLSKPKPKGLKAPNQKNVGKVLNRLNRMSIPYDSYGASVYGSKNKIGTSFDKVIGDKKFNPAKSQKLYESSNKSNQIKRSTRLSKYNAERTIGTNQGYKGYSGKLDTKKSDIVKNIKKFRTMGNIKKLTPVGLIGAIMQPKKVGDATLNGNKGEYRKVK